MSKRKLLDVKIIMDDYPFLVSGKTVTNHHGEIVARCIAPKVADIIAGLLNQKAIDKAARKKK